MKKKIPYILAYWWVMLLFALGLFVLIFADRNGGFSASENRDLQSAPRFSLKSWFDGSFSREAEAFLTDQFPEREPVVKTANRMLGVFDATTEEERILDQAMIAELEGMNEGDGGEETGFDESVEPDDPDVIAAPETPDPASAALPDLPETPAPVETPVPGTNAAPAPTPVDLAVKNTSTTRKFSLRKADGTLTTRFNFGKDAIEDTIRSLNAYREAVPENGSVVFTYIPYSQDANEWLLYPEKFSGWYSDVEPTIQANVDDGVYVFSTVNELEPHMQNGELCFFKTDHHWTGLGAFYMQRLMMRSFGVPSVSYDDFTYTVHEDFTGSISSKVHALSGYRDLKDRLEVPGTLAPTRAFVYRNVDQLVKEVRFMEPERVVYAAFLGGTHDPFYVAETGFHTGHSAIVICDSFGLAIVPYIAPYYDRVCLVDFRDTHNFIKQSGGYNKLKPYFAHYGIDDVYFIVSRGCGINSSYMRSIVRKYLG
ncbi:MAG: hypothetical protein IJL62_05270 [Clostridia bacterium]|nr:hypothetical protein [Clostridia bacterium]